MFDKKEPAWTSENINKIKGDTNYQYCGWCEYRGSGSYRYDCMIEGSCNLLKEYDKNVKFDTECVIKKLGKSDVESIIESKRSRIYEYQQSIEQKNNEILILNNLILDDVPVLPDNRKCNHFNINDEIMLYPNFYDSLIKSKWLKGKVINGYRHHDGCVSVFVEEKCHNGEYLDGHGSGSGLCVPTILLKKEYDWFVKHPEKFRQWIESACDKDFNGKKFCPDDFVNPS